MKKFEYDLIGGKPFWKNPLCYALHVNGHKASCKLKILTIDACLTYIRIRAGDSNLYSITVMFEKKSCHRNSCIRIRQWREHQYCVIGKRTCQNLCLHFLRTLRRELVRPTSALYTGSHIVDIHHHL